MCKLRETEMWLKCIFLTKVPGLIDLVLVITLTGPLFLTKQSVSSTYPHGAKPIQLMVFTALSPSHLMDWPSLTASPTHCVAPQFVPPVRIQVQAVWDACSMKGTMSEQRRWYFPKIVHTKCQNYSTFSKLFNIFKIIQIHDFIWIHHMNKLFNFHPKSVKLKNN